MEIEVHKRSKVIAFSRLLLGVPEYNRLWAGWWTSYHSTLFHLLFPMLPNEWVLLGSGPFMHLFIDPQSERQISTFPPVLLCLFNFTNLVILVSQNYRLIICYWDFSPWTPNSYVQLSSYLIIMLHGYDIIWNWTMVECVIETCYTIIYLIF